MSDSESPKSEPTKLIDMADELSEAAKPDSEPAKAETADSGPAKPKSGSAKAETAVEEPKPLPKEPRKGVYTLEAGDTPGIVSISFYGRSNRARELVQANPDCDWQPGSIITLV
jgi:hypothetical protein